MAIATYIEYRPTLAIRTYNISYIYSKTGAAQGKINTSNIYHKESICLFITINITEIPVQTEAKYLGLHIDQKLT